MTEFAKYLRRRRLRRYGQELEAVTQMLHRLLLRLRTRELREVTERCRAAGLCG